MTWRVGADRNLRIVEEAEWDGDAAKKSIFKWAGFDSGKPNPRRARRGFLVYDDGNDKVKSGYKLPFAKVVGSELVASTVGVNAASNRLPQTKIPADVKRRARAVIDHYQGRIKRMRDKKKNAAVSYIDSFVDSLWAVSPSCARFLFRRIETFLSGELSAELLQTILLLDDDDDDYPAFPHFAEIVGKTVVINISGVLSKRRLLSGPPTYGEIEEAVRRATVDGEINRIVLLFDTPGGSLFGVEGLADAIWLAQREKPVISYVLYNCHSAGYWAASQGTEIVASSTAMVGCIGTYVVLRDETSRAHKMGYVYHLVTSGGVKGLGAEGTEVIEELLEDVQIMVDDAQALFNRAIVRGRPELADDVEQLADGRSFFADKALQLGLIDGVAPFEEIVSREYLPLLEEKLSIRRRALWLPTRV